MVLNFVFNVNLRKINFCWQTLFGKPKNVFSLNKKTFFKEITEKSRRKKFSKKIENFFQKELSRIFFVKNMY